MRKRRLLEHPIQNVSHNIHNNTISSVIVNALYQERYNLLIL